MTTSRTVTSILLSLSLTASARAADPSPCKINVNQADLAQLALFVRTGPVLSGRIAEARPLDAARLDAVKGVGEAWLRDNAPHVTYTGPTTCTEKLKAPKVPKVAPVTPAN